MRQILLLAPGYNCSEKWNCSHPMGKCHATTLTHSCRKQLVLPISLLELGNFLKNTMFSVTSVSYQYSFSPPLSSWEPQTGQGICVARCKGLKTDEKEPDPATQQWHCWRGCTATNSSPDFTSVPPTFWAVMGHSVPPHKLT